MSCLCGQVLVSVQDNYHLPDNRPKLNLDFNRATHAMKLEWQLFLLLARNSAKPSACRQDLAGEMFAFIDGIFAFR